MRLEIGGGTKQLGDGWLNIDKCPTADVQWDLEKLPWPLDDDSADEIYSCHCIEHVAEPMDFLQEIARIGKIGAPVEIRCPHPGSHLAMRSGHKHVFSPIHALNIDQYFPKESWTKHKRLKLRHIEYASSVLLDEAKRALPFLKGVPDQTIMAFFPVTCHESRFYYNVVENEFLT
jgi:hypothetical protein